MTVFRQGTFYLASGVRSDFKIDCDGLTRQDWRCVAMLLASRIPEPFDNVVSVPTGGDLLAQCMRKYAKPSTNGPPRNLVVDDVYTTGRSIERLKKDLMMYGVEEDTIKGAVVFARNPTPDWITPLFLMQ